MQGDDPSHVELLIDEHELHHGEIENVRSIDEGKLQPWKCGTASSGNRSRKVCRSAKPAKLIIASPQFA
jgi:hypothetical protein